MTIKKDILSFLFSPLLSFKKTCENGDEVFQEIFYNRTEALGQINFSLDIASDITIIGNPGEGKSTLMHYMFIEAARNKNVYPIILDYRDVYPRSPEGLLVDFVYKMKKYFIAIEKPITNIINKTTVENVDQHFHLIQSHLANIPLKEIQASKKLVILLDDLDYLEKAYFKLLKHYFVAFTASDKSIVILSGRKPLINSIGADDELRQAFNLNPRKIFLVRVDFNTLIKNRLSVFFEESELNIYGKMIHFFRGKKVIEILKNNLLSHIRIKQKNDTLEIEDDDLDIQFDFNSNFYTYLSDVTGRNLRDVEFIIPQIWEFHENHKTNDINFNTDFISSYINCTYKYEHLLLDLVSEKTDGQKKKHKGNSILQIILEYFSSHYVVNEKFYQEMKRFGIEKEIADLAINKLSKSPFSLLDPTYSYEIGNKLLFRRYDINRKGLFYLREICENDLYYQRLSDYFTMNSDGLEITISKSNNRYIKVV